MNSDEKNISELLSSVIDPELMVNIIDLGLVYGIKYKEDEKQVDIDLTLTSPGCPMGGVIMEDIQNTLQSEYPDFEVNITLVWDPPWSVRKLTDRGREELGYF